MPHSCHPAAPLTLPYPNPGGLGGFGSNNQIEPPRNPKAAYCIVFSDTPEACLAARAAGIRTVGVAGEEDVDVDEALESAADVVFEWDEAGSIVLDDLYTPGSFWLNPPTPRDADGNWCDADWGPGDLARDGMGTPGKEAADHEVEVVVSPSAREAMSLTSAEQAILDELSNR